MTGPQLIALLKQMEKIDSGQPAPRISGQYGNFLRQYAKERGELVSLAVANDVPIRADGAISGEPLERITLIPVDSSAVVSTDDSPWGPVGRYIALCPELMACVVLRLWLSGASGRDAFRNLAAHPQTALDVYGDFRWLPPGTLTAGRADFETRPLEPRERWEDAPFLKVTGDDLNDIPHALDFRDVHIQERFALAHLRSFVALRETDAALLVPGGLRPKAVRMTVRNPHVLSLGYLAEATLLRCLGYREPGEEAWTIWLATPCEPRDALMHGVRWAAHQRYLRGAGLPTHEIMSGCRSALEDSGVLADVTDVDEIGDIGPSPGPLAEFVRAVAATLST